MSTHRGSARPIPKTQLAGGALAVVALVVGLMLGQRGSPGDSSPVADVCQPGSGGSAAACGTPTASPSSAGSSPLSTTFDGKFAVAAPATADGAASGSPPNTPVNISPVPASTRPASTPHRPRPTRPRATRTTPPAVDLDLPPVNLPTCLLGCR